MRTFNLLPIAIAAAAVASAVQAQVITVGPNINVTKQAGSQSETGIAISRTNPNLIALSSNAQGTMVNKFSTNAGSTWSNSALQVAGGYDSWMGADSFGNIFLSYQVSTVTSVARSADGGANYSVTAIPVSGADHPEMSIGPGVTHGTNSIFLRDTDASGQNRVISATSSGLGISTGYTVQTGLGSGNFGSTAVGPQGQTIFTSMNPSNGVGSTNMVLQYDATGTNPGGYVPQSTLTTNVGGFRPVPAQPNRTVDAQIELEYDFSGGANNGTLYALYTQADNNSTNDTNIVFRRSTNNGLTFSNELKLNNDAGTNSQFFGRLAVDQTTGWLASVWYDARNSPTNNKVEVWGTVSFNGGLNWEPNFKISGGMTNCINSGGNNDANECGDYISMDFYNGTLVTAWADSSNSTGDNPNGTSQLDIYFAKVTVAIPEPSTYALMALGLLAVGWRARRRVA